MADRLRTSSPAEGERLRAALAVAREQAASLQARPPTAPPRLAPAQPSCFSSLIIYATAHDEVSLSEPNCFEYLSERCFRCEGYSQCVLFDHSISDKPQI